MNRRSLLRSMLAAPLAALGIVKVAEAEPDVPTYKGVPLEYISDLETATLYDESSYGIRGFADENAAYSWSAYAMPQEERAGFMRRWRRENRAQGGGS